MPENLLPKNVVAADGHLRRTEGQKDRRTGGQEDRRAEGQKGRRAGGQKGRRAEGQKGRRAGGQKGRRAGGQEGRRAEGQKGRRAEGQKGRRAGGQEGRRAEGQKGRRAGGQEGRRAEGQKGREDRWRRGGGEVAAGCVRISFQKRYWRRGGGKMPENLLPKKGDDSVLYNIKDTVDLMIPAIKGVEDQNTIDEQEDEQALPRTSTVPVIMQTHKPQPQILTNFDDHASLSKSVKSQRPRQRPIAHPELSDLSIDDPAPALHTSTMDTVRTPQTENEGNARADTGTEDPVGEQGEGDGSSDGMVTGAAVSSEPNSGAEDSGHGYNATAAVVSCEGTPINTDRRHASSGMEDLGTSVGDLGVDTSTTTGAHMIKATVPSIHNGSLTTLVPKTSRAEVPSKQSAPKSTTHVTASKISKRPRGSTANSPGHANKKARKTYADGNDLDSDDFVVVKATM
ncbi:hypothetical protein F4604DRAFT_1933317 [Suillus subluteus]|nr:hypothetical protein F4604DRAFT_1933317 [Suillus subluteus]